MSDGRHIVITPALSERGFRPLVSLGEGETAVTLSPHDARLMAEGLQRAAAQAEAESLLAIWLSGIPGMDAARRQAALSDLRAIAVRELHGSIIDGEKRRRKSDREEPLSL